LPISRAKDKRAAALAGPVEVTTLHPLAEDLALFLSEGDRSRWKIISQTCVIVLNHPPKPRRTIR